MSKLGHKAITILLISTILLSLVPTLTVHAVGVPVLDDYSGQVGDEIEVEGTGVTAGSIVNIYWDSVKSWDASTGAGLLGSTEADSDGTFDFEFDVPEATNGNHYVWVKDLDTGETEVSAAFMVLTDVDLSTNSGLEEDDITVDGTGFAGDTDVLVGLFDDFTTAPVVDVVDEDTGEEGDGDEDEFTFSLEETPVVPETLVVWDSNEVFTDDDGDGSLDGDQGGDGSINYVTGEVELDFESAPADGDPIMANYSYYVDQTNVASLLTTDGDSDAVGSFSETVQVPLAGDMGAGTYDLVSLDADGNTFTATFTIGAVVTIDKDAAKVGEIIEAEGRGFDEGDMVTDVSIDGISCYIYDDPIEVESDGEFDLEFVVPQVDDEDDDYVITFTVGGVDVTVEDFEVTDLAEVDVDPDYGLQGEKVTVSGVNFPNDDDEEVTVSLGGLGEKTFDLDSDGTFSGTYTIPGVSQGVHDLVAEADEFNIDDSASFKAGLIVVVATPDSVKVGERITFTGTGFTGGEDWNATFGDMEITEEEPVMADGTFTYAYYVPTMDTGTYVVTFNDMDSDIEVSTEVTVTETTMVEVDPAMAPNEYDVIIEGWNFIYDDGVNVEFTLYNDTEDWDISDDVYIYDAEDDIYTNDPDVETDAEEGNFTAWWEVYESEDLSMGTYTLLVEVDDDWMYETEFEIIEKTVTVSSRKDTFRISDTVAFDIVNSFQQDDSYVEIYDPAGDLYWQTDEFNRDIDWIKVGTVYRVPYFEQTAGGNPMILTSDAPLGTWTYSMFDEDDEVIATGSFTVAEAPEAVLEERINELGQDISDLQDELAGVRDDVSDAKNSADEAKAAADAATDAIQDIGETATSAKDAADAAKDAANEAKDAATGIQTLVYVAIGGSVIAALAAIVSLMQISRRIAG